MAACGGGDGDDGGATTTEATTTTESDDSTTTTAVDEEPAFEATAVAAGDQHACALDPDGQALLLGLQPHGPAR